MLLAELSVMVEKPLDWVFRKKHQTHFHTNKNASQSLPKLTNTPGLYDGSAEARAIVKAAQEAVGDLKDGNTAVVIAHGILYHVMDYLKGKDPVNPGMWTSDFMGEEEEPLSELEQQAISQMTMERLEEPASPFVVLGAESGRIQCNKPSFTEVDKGESSNT